MKTFNNSNLKHISDLFSYNHYKVKIDYDKKILTYDCSTYGNESSSKFSKEIDNLKDSVDSIFKKNLIISRSNLKSLINSKTHGPSVLKTIKNEILGKIPFYSYDNSDDQFFNEIDENTIESIKDELKLEDRSKDFKARALKSGKIPKILKPIKKDLALTFYEFVLLHSEPLENIKKHFTIAPRYYSRNRYSRNTHPLNTILKTLNIQSDFFEKALKFGFEKSCFENLDYYKDLKTVAIFNEIGA